jgi:hypothetical protein
MSKSNCRWDTDEQMLVVSKGDHKKCYSERQDTENILKYPDYCL